MEIVPGILLFLQVPLLLMILARAVRFREIVSLRNVVYVANLAYSVLPLGLALPREYVVVNGASVLVQQEALTLGALMALAFSLGCFFLPRRTSYESFSSLLPEWYLYLILSVFNTLTLIDYIAGVGVSDAIFLLISANASVYRDLAYDVLSQEAFGYGYVPKLLQLAIFALLWINSYRPRYLLVVLILPVVLLDIITFGRHTLASFLLCILLVWQVQGRYALLLLTGPVLALGFFFSRVIAFVFFDQNYSDWLGSNLGGADGSFELVGEFFNTFGTFLMAESQTFDIRILDLFGTTISQWLFPPSTGSFVMESLGAKSPVDEVSNVIRTVYGPHPAHHSFIDILSFGPLALVSFLTYFVMIAVASRSKSVTGLVIYLFLLMGFYIGLRGSLFMTLPRLLWMALVLMVWRIAVLKLTDQCRGHVV